MELFTQLLNHIIKTYDASIYWIDDENPEVTHFVLRNDTTSFSLSKTYKEHLVDLNLMSLKDIEENLDDIAEGYFILADLDAKCFDDYVSRIRKYFED